jgi:MFS family permease
MIKSLGIGLSDAGLIISVIALCIAIFSFLGAVIIERLGTLRALLVGIWLLGLAEIASGYSPNFAIMLLCRIVEGVGYGIIIGPPAALVMQWFGEREWPYVNMVNAVCAYLGITLVFAVTPSVYYAVGSSWHRVLTSYGLIAVTIAILWTVFGRERETARATLAHGERGPSNLPEVMRMRGVILMAIALFGRLWVFQLYTAFLPEFFRVERGLNLNEAAKLTAVLPFAGIFAAAVGGIGTGVVGLRRPFLWPMAVLTLIGCLGAVLLPAIDLVRLSLVLVGIGASAGLAATGTLMMELPGIRGDLGGRLRRRVYFAIPWRRTRAADGLAQRHDSFPGVRIITDYGDVPATRDRARTQVNPDCHGSAGRTVAIVSGTLKDPSPTDTMPIFIADLPRAIHPAIQALSDCFL